MAFLPRAAALGLLSLIAQPVAAALPDPVRAMIDAAIATGDREAVETVATLAKVTNPDDVAEIDALVATFQAAETPAVDLAEAAPEPDPIRTMLDAAMASGRDNDVEAVAKVAKTARPEDAAEIDALLVDYRAQRLAEKEAADAAARAELAQAKLWQNWKGEGQIGASHSTGNTQTTGLALGLAFQRTGLNWHQKFRAQGDYQRTDGQTTVERYLAEYEPQLHVSDRAFVYGLGRWESDRMQGFSTRWNVSAGMGYKVIETEKVQLSLKAGPAWRRTNYIARPDASELTALAGLDFGWQLSPTLRLTQVASTIIGESNVTTSSLTAINAKLTGALSARLAYSLQLDSSPPIGIEKVDTLTRFTLAYSF